jgi:hypothetical protein
MRRATLYPCSGCDRHLRDSDLLCPFCGTLQELAGPPSLGPVALAVALLGTAACGTPSPGDGSTAGTTTTMSSTTDADLDSDSSTTLLDTGDATDDGDTSPGSFYAGPSDFGSPLSCSPWDQDCPEGEKCVPYSSTGGDFDANKCVPVLGDGEPGEPCNYGGTAEATDDCGADSYCWAAGDTGICYAFCQDDPDFICENIFHDCMVDEAGVVTLCSASCDPLLQDCTDPGFACYVSNAEQLVSAICAPTTENIELGDPCDAINDCAAGLACRPADMVPDCAGDSCCASFCDLTMPVCPQPGTECTTLETEGMAPGSPWGDVGLCLLPQP